MKYTKEFIQEKIQTNMIWLTRGILAIYARQTDDEKKVQTTKYFNNRGFNGADAKFMSSIAEQLIKGRSLSEKQTYCCRKRMMKYCGQLANIANENMAAA